MKYKAYEQLPHSALLEIKQAFDDEKPYKAQSICLKYFNHLENQRHIDKALDYASKDDVYKYISDHMKNGVDTKNSSRYYIERFKEKTEELRKQSQELKRAMNSLEQFCTDSGFDLDSLLEKYSKKTVSNMTPEELTKANNDVTARQADKIATSKDIISMPTMEEHSKLMTEQAEINYNSFIQKLESGGSVW